MRFLYLAILCSFTFSAFSQTWDENVDEGLNDLRFRTGIYAQYNFLESKTFSLGLNLLATHGQLSNNRYIFYGAHVGLNKFNADSLNVFGVEIGLSTKIYNSVPLGLEIDATAIMSEDNIRILPTVGIGFFGFLSVNYGYYFSVENVPKYKRGGHHLALKMVLNFSSAEFFNTKGVSKHKW